MTHRFQVGIFIPDEWYDLPNMFMRHQPVAFRHAAVWFGKPAPAISRNNLRRIKAQLKEGFPTEVLILNPHSHQRVVYCAPLLAVSASLPKQKEFIPKFYEVLDLFPRMKAWLKIGLDWDAYFWDEVPALERFITTYNLWEKKFLLKGPVTMPGYALLSLGKPPVLDRAKQLIKTATDRFRQ